MSPGEEYQARGTDIKQLLMELARKLEAHEQKFRAKPKDWGFPADLGYVRKQLENLTLFLGGESGRRPIGHLEVAG